MKGLVVIPEPQGEWSFLGQDSTPTLLPLLDRPMLQHVIECLVSAGARHITVASMVALDAVRLLLKDGKRWGVTITVTPLQSADHLTAIVGTFDADDKVLVANAECLPDLAGVPIEETPDCAITVGGIHTGWCLVTAAHFADIPALPWNSIPDMGTLEVRSVLCVSAPNEYREAWRSIVEGGMPGIVRTGIARDGVVIGRGANVHPSAKLKAPVYVGERTLIGKDCELGPDAYVGADCIVDDGATVEGGLVLDHTYVGPRIEITRKIAARSTVYDLDRGVAVSAIEDFLLGSTGRAPGFGPGMFERIGAAIVGTVLLPFVLVGVLTRSAVQKPEDSIGQQSVSLDALCSLIPGLWTVVMGRTRIVGRPELSPARQRAVGELAAGLYESLPQGLITDAYLRFGPEPSDDELWASMAFSVSLNDRRNRFALVKEYLTYAVGMAKPRWRN